MRSIDPCKKVQLLFPNPLMGKVRAVADKEDRPVSEIIRWAMEKFIDIKLTKAYGER